MHRPSVSTSWFAASSTTNAAHHSVAAPWLRRVLRAWRRSSSLSAGFVPMTRSSMLFIRAALDEVCNGQRRGVHDEAVDKEPGQTRLGAACHMPSRLHVLPRTAALQSGLRGLRLPPCDRFTASASSAACSSTFPSAAFVCARRWAAVGRRPTYQEIAEALDTLSVGITDDPAAIKKRYRELVKAHHPDAGGDEKTMSKITVAYDRLEGLSKREKEEFALQKKMFGGSGGTSNPYQARAGYAGRRGGANPFGYAYGNTGGSADNDPFRSGTGASGHYYQGADPFANGRAQQQSYWNFYNRQKGASGSSFSENPFAGGNPFSMHNQMRRARFMPSGTLFVQGFVLYLFVTFMLLFAYRTYRDYRHEDGWRMSESLARHEQLQELHRLRQEMNERARQMQGSEDPYGLNRPLRANETAESRALEYARQRRIQAIQDQRQQQQVRGGDLPELRGWPKITEEQGRITKRAQDPPGVVFFEPTPQDARARQVRNSRRTDSAVSSWKTKAESSAEAERAAKTAAASSSSNGEAASAVAPGVPGGMGTHGTDPSRPLPAESNVGAVFASQVSNNAETREALNKILGLVRNASREQDAESK